MQKPIHTPRSPTSGARRFGVPFGLLIIALVLAACTTPATPVPDFTLSFSGGGSADGTVEIEQGDELDITVTVNGSGGFSGQVTLNSGVATAQVAGIDVSFDDDTVSGSATMTIMIDGSVDFNDDYTLSVTGTSGSLSDTATLTIDVTEATSSFDLTTSAPSVTISAGGSDDVTVTVTPISGFSDDVTLGVTSADGITGSFDVNPVPGASGDSVVTLSVPGTLAAGSYTVTITGTSGSVADSVDMEVIVIDPSTLVVDPTGDDTTGDGSFGNPFRTISKALSLVAIDGTILVQDGTYDTEAFPLTIGVDVTIQGESEAGTVIDNPATTTDVFYANAGDLILNDLTISGGSDGIQIEGANDLTASNITVMDFFNRALHLNGAGSSTVSVDNATVTAGTATQSDIIEMANTGSTVSITNTTIDGSAATNDTPEGIDVKEAAAVTLDNVTISNVPDGGVEVDDTVSGATTFTMSNTTITGSGNVAASTGIGLTISSDLASIDIGTNNSVSGSDGREFVDERPSGGTNDVTIDAVGLILNGLDIADGVVTGPAISGGRYEIVNDTTVDFGL